MLLVIFLAIGVATMLLPLLVDYVVKQFPSLPLYKSPSWLPVAAGVLFVVALYLPDIHISSETETFQMHFIGGGLYSLLLYVYFKKLFGWKFRWFTDLVMLLGLVSILGVANELLEFTMVKTGLANFSLNDTSWDLVANTSGALIGYAIYRLIGRIGHPGRHRRFL